MAWPSMASLLIDRSRCCLSGPSCECSQQPDEQSTSGNHIFSPNPYSRLLEEYDALSSRDWSCTQYVQVGYVSFVGSSSAYLMIFLMG